MITKLVVLLVVATLVSGSLAVALPLKSSENKDRTQFKLMMYDDSGMELSKRNNVYLVKTGDIVYLQLSGITDNSIMSSGTMQNGEMEVLIHYSHDSKNYSILFKQVLVQNGNTEQLKWVVGDFDADMQYDSNNPNDTAILCGTNGAVIYGKITSTKQKYILQAINSTKDFIGYCETENISTDDDHSSDANLHMSISTKDKKHSAGNKSGTALTAENTATGFFERLIVYDWNLEKTVSPTSVENKPNEYDSVTYTLAATRMKVSDSNQLGVRGKVCVTNGGEVSTENLKIVDRVQFKTGKGKFQDLLGASLVVDTSANPVLDPGESDCYPYEIIFIPVPNAEYRNVVKVTITNHSGKLGKEFGPEPKVGFNLPSSPTISEFDAEADLFDLQTCTAGFVCTSINTGQGTESWHFTSPNIVSFDKKIQNSSVQCENSFALNNVATLIERDTKEQRNGSAVVNIFTGGCPAVGKEAKPMGFWKNYEYETTALLPQTLGNYIVTTFAQAEAVFDAANAQNIHNMLAAQLLATKLNKANGVPNGCIDSAIITADDILLTAGYSGPNTTTPPQSSAKATVNAVKDALDAFNNNGC